MNMLLSTSLKIIKSSYILGLIAIEDFDWSAIINNLIM